MKAQKEEKLIYTLKRNILVKTRQDLVTNFIVDVSDLHPSSGQFAFTMSKIHNQNEILVKAQSIISAPLIANYILKLKVKKKYV